MLNFLYVASICMYCWVRNSALVLLLLFILIVNEVSSRLSLICPVLKCREVKVSSLDFIVRADVIFRPTAVSTQTKVTGAARAVYARTRQ